MEHSRPPVSFLLTTGTAAAAPAQAVDNLMPGFDREIARMAQRLLIQGRLIDYHTGVIASKVTPGVPGGAGGLLCLGARGPD